MECTRCAICNEKTNKRMVRPAPLNFPEIAAQLHRLQNVVAACNLPAAETDNTKLRDGFGSANGTSFARLKSAQQMRQGRVDPSKVINLDDPNPVPAVQRCRLCPKGVDPISFPPSVQFGSMMPAQSSKKSRDLFSHERCALFSEDVYELDGVVQNVERAILRSKKIMCGRDACGRMRANVICAADGCSISYHFPCAIVAGCAIVEDGYKMFCVKHRSLAPEIDEGEFVKVMSDPTDAVAMEHEDNCYLCLNGGRLLMCDTCERVTHPACSGLKSLPDGDWSCGVCTGAHTMAQVEADRSGHANKGRTSIKRRKAEREGELEEDDDYDPRKRARTKKKAQKSLNRAPRYVLANTSLSSTQKDKLQIVAKARKAMMKADMDKRVTHLIIRSNTKEETPPRTMKLCVAIARKIPVMCWKWIEESAKFGDWAPSEHYLHPLTWPRDQPSIFAGMRFFFGPFDGAREKREDMINLVTAGGGSVLHRDPSIDSGRPSQKLFYVFDGEHSVYNRRELLSRYDPPPEADVVSSGWILDRLTKNRY